MSCVGEGLRGGGGQWAVVGVAKGGQVAHALRGQGVVVRLHCVMDVGLVRVRNGEGTGKGWRRGGAILAEIINWGWAHKTCK